MSNLPQVLEPKAQYDSHLNPRVNALTEEIRADHAEVIEFGSKALDAAIRAGEKLTKLKGLLIHGTFIPWVEDNGGMSRRTAQLYMELHRWKAQLKNVPTITEAVRVIKEKKNGTRKKPATIDPAAEWKKRLAAVVRDGESWISYVFSVDEDGNLLKFQDGNPDEKWAAQLLAKEMPYIVKRAARILYPDVTFPKDEHD